MTLPLGAVTRRIIVRTRGGIVPPNNATDQITTRMMLLPEEGSGPPILVPYAPRQVEWADVEGEYITQNRPGLIDALIYSKPKLEKINFSLLLVDKQLRAGWGVYTNISVLEVMYWLRTYAKTGIKLRLAYSSMEAGSYRITSYRPQSVMRDEFDEITQCIAEIELTQASDVRYSWSNTPLAATSPSALVASATNPAFATGNTTTAGTAASTTTTTTNSGPVTTHPIKAGDTLFAIAVLYYGNGNRWKEIADANGITDPRTLQIGKVLRIP